MALRIKHILIGVMACWIGLLNTTKASPILPDSTAALEAQAIQEGTAALRQLMASNQANFRQGNSLANQYVFTIGQGSLPPLTNANKFSAVYQSGSLNNTLSDNTSYLFKLVEIDALNQRLVTLNNTLYQAGKPLIYVGVDYLLGNIYKFQYLKNTSNVSWSDFNKNQDISQAGYVSVKELYDNKYKRIFSSIKNQVINNTEPDSYGLYPPPADKGIVIVGVGQFFEIKIRTSKTDASEIEPAFKRWFWNGMSVEFGPDAGMTSTAFINQVNAAGKFAIKSSVQESLLKFTNQISDVLMGKATLSADFVDMSKKGNGTSGLTVLQVENIRKAIQAFNDLLKEYNLKIKGYAIDPTNAQAVEGIKDAKSGPNANPIEDDFFEIDGLPFRLNLWSGMGPITPCRRDYVNQRYSTFKNSKLYQNLTDANRAGISLLMVGYYQMLATMVCATDSNAVRTKPCAHQAIAGALNCMLTDYDVAELIASTIDTGEKMFTYAQDKVQNYPYRMMGYYQQMQNGTLSDNEIPNVIKDIMLPLFPIGTAIADVAPQAYQAAVGFKDFYFTNATCYRSGELAMMVIPAIATLGVVAAAKAPKLFNRLKNITGLADPSSVKAALDAMGDGAKNGRTIGKATDDLAVIVDGDLIDKEIKKTSTGCQITIGCFVAGTLISTAVGFTPIEQIQAGDLVLAHNTYTHQSTYKPVTSTFSKRVTGLIRIVAGRDTVYTTANHPFWVNNKWTRADALQVGDELVSLATPALQASIGTMPHLARAALAIDNLAQIDSTTTVYNMEVDEVHTYLIGNQGILVHNGDCRATQIRVVTSNVRTEINSLPKATLTGQDVNRISLYKNNINEFLDLDFGNNVPFDIEALRNDVKRGYDGGGTKSELLAHYIFGKYMPDYQRPTFDIKYGSNNGFDGVYIKYNATGQVEDIIINESKQFGAYKNVNGKSVWEDQAFELNKVNGALPTQMSDAWITYVLDKMTQPNQPIEKRQLAELINQNRSKITRTVTGINKNTGNLSIVKL